MSGRFVRTDREGVLFGGNMKMAAGFVSAAENGGRKPKRGTGFFSFYDKVLSLFLFV